MRDMMQERKELIRYGDIVKDHSWDDEDGSYRETIVKLNEKHYRIRMRNGEVLTIATI